MGSTFYRASYHKEWADAGLEAIQDRHEMEYVNQTDDGPDQFCGEWYIADDASRAIIYGTFGNYNSPGASHYTYAEVYDDADEYRAALDEWEAKPEYLDTDDEQDDEQDDSQPLFSVIEHSSHFAVRHNPTGQEAPMGDGVDTLHDDDGNPLSPGTPGFVEAWTDALNASEDDTLAAYFPDLAD